MKTLEELIESMLLASEVNRQYREENADVLHYLKCYQDCLKQMENNQMIIEDAVRQRDAHIKALAEMKRNDPLTWDELRQMLGKPVWMEWNECKGWRLVNCFDSVTTGKKAVALTDRFGVDFVFDEETIVKCEVKVYRKERE